MKHTKGKWDYRETDGGEYDIHANNILNWVAVLKQPPEMGSEEVLANAKLIAAAPEMLGALKKIAHLGDDLCKCPACRISKEVIKKATGS